MLSTRDDITLIVAGLSIRDFSDPTYKCDLLVRGVPAQSGLMMQLIYVSAIV